MKVKVLYPAAFTDLPDPDRHGNIVMDVPDKHARALIEQGYAEPHGREAKASAPVEQATAAPGEKRTTRRPRTKKAT